VTTTATPTRSAPAETREASGGESRNGSTPSSVGADLDVCERLIRDAKFAEERSAHIAQREGHMLAVSNYWRCVEWREKLESLRDELRGRAA
jgi:hypothetical protein